MKCAPTLSLIFFVSFFAITTHAAPSVGDQVVYDLTHVQKNIVDGTFVMTNTITAIDSTAQTISIEQTITQNGKVMSTQTIANPTANVAYPDDATIAECGIVSYPGQTGDPETITVQAGTFKTCHIVLNSNSTGDKGEYYAAAVPFGFVKSISTTSTGTMTAELVSFQKQP